MSRGGLTLLAWLAATGGAGAQPIYDHLRIIAPAAPGGGWDQTARAMQQALQASGLVSSSSVENIAGAAGTIGLARLISAERGTANVVMVSGLIMLGAVVTHHSPVTLSDVTPIARLTGEYEAIVVPAQSPYRTLGALVEAFRARPESISWGGGSAGGTDQILAGLVADAVGVSPRRVNYIAFSGGGESMSAILGGQVTAGISGLGEYASQLDAGTLRILAISGAERVPGVDAPTLREQGVDVVLENWRSLVGPPDMSAADRARLERAVEAMVGATAWRDMLQRYRWSDRYLAGEPFARFVADEEARVVSILDKLGINTIPTATPSVGRYPIAVLGGLSLTVAMFLFTVVRSRHESDARIDRGAIAVIAAAIALNVVLIEAAGFVVASVVLFWLTARAFDARHPWRDATAAIVLSVGAYLVFARVLQIPLPAGMFARWM
jgi:putative tricarboxylic transport membrane protein